ncbi:MAG: TonB-dependent receptor [Bacteroidales bacterium]|nr:TonB-dependent receptor [Bacteroidales bacterium]
MPQKRFLTLITAIALISFPVISQAQRYAIRGHVKDKVTGETLLSANIYEASTTKGTVSNNYGFYSIVASAGKVNIVCSYIGYQPQMAEFDLRNDTLINFDLEPTLELAEVVITDKGPQQNIRSSQMSMLELPILQAKQLPVLLGEVDIIKSLQLMPGVQSGSEGSTGLYVRGGGPDQNLILLDGVPVYNVNHLFGFLSVFNADAIKSVSLIKGGFPARYGGRLSSVIDVRMKEGNMKEIHGDGAVGVISSQLTLEGPIIKDKTSFIISGRRSYLDLLTYPFQLAFSKRQGGDYTSFAGFYFYDLNAKVNHIFNENNRLFLSGYMGRDNFYLKTNSHTDYAADNYTSDEESRAGIDWGNATLALRWNHVFTPRLFSNLTLTFSDFTFEVGAEFSEDILQDTMETHNEQEFRYYSRIRDYGLQYDFEYNPLPSHYIRYGFKNTLHTFSPGIMVYNIVDSDLAMDTTFGNEDIPANEFMAYLEDDIQIGKRLKVNAGIHYSNFYLEDTLYHSFEPRISARYMVNDDWSIKASYVKMTQYMNLLANSTLGLPTDLWIPCTRNIHPQRAWQVAAGAAVAIGNEYEITLEGFYKKMSNLVEYKEGSSFFSLNTDWESVVTQGEGESYGFEIFAQKSGKKTSGWIGYTLSWSYRQFEDISYGRRFPYKYDRRHDIAIVLTHTFSDKFNMGANWVFSTGNALTLGDERFVSHHFVMNEMMTSYDPMYDYFGGSYTSYFETRNSFRMPLYHRLDWSLNFPRQRRWWKETFSVGVYNTYGRRNPYYLYEASVYNELTNSSETVIKQVSLLTFIPFIRYGFTF